MIACELEIKNPTGLHARPASQLCKIAKNCNSTITITCGDKLVNPRSIFSILRGEMTKGKKIKIVAEGEDEKDVIASIAKVIKEQKVAE